MDFQFLIWAIFLGGLSAASLPLGSLLGLIWSPNNRIVGVMTAFGGGALLAALAIELVAPTALDLVHAANNDAKIDAVHHLLKLIFGAIGGGIVFVVLDEIINSKGGFLRKTSTTIEYFTKRKSERRREILEHLSISELVRHLPFEAVEEMVTKANEQCFQAGELIFEEGDAGNEVFFLETGKINISSSGQEIASLKAGDVLGEIALVTGAPRTATARAALKTTVFSFHKEDFDAWRERYPPFEKAAKTLAANRLKELLARDGVDLNAAEWVESIMNVTVESAIVPSQSQLQRVSEQHDGAPLAIWLGIMLDGIPESFVIGSALLIAISAVIGQTGPDYVTLGSVMPYTLIAGLFLANFPEAMSSSIGMKKQGWTKTKILSMWLSLTVMTSIGAGAGYWFGDMLDHGILVLIEGFAAGAMLTMIAAAMIPEAIHLGGRNSTGLATLAGFLSAISFKFLE